jgi:sterol desaturase/sphingolipid hydroxylase (fatty acid hydroxylase superfamily)
MFFVYWIELPFFERYKISDEPWPWKVNNREWRVFLKKSISLVAVNNFITYPLILTILKYLNNWEPNQTYDVKKIPTPFRLFIIITFYTICEDFSFYFIHRLMHIRWLYPIHKVHHNYN